MQNKIIDPTDLLTEEQMHKWDLLVPLSYKYDSDGIEFLVDLLNEPLAICKLNLLQDIIKNNNLQQIQNIANLHAAVSDKKPSKFKRWLNKTHLGKFANWYNRNFSWFHKNGNK